MRCQGNLNLQKFNLKKDMDIEVVVEYQYLFLPPFCIGFGI